MCCFCNRDPAFSISRFFLFFIISHSHRVSHTPNYSYHTLYPLFHGSQCTHITHRSFSLFLSHNLDLFVPLTSLSSYGKIRSTGIYIFRFLRETVYIVVQARRSLRRLYHAFGETALAKSVLPPR